MKKYSGNDECAIRTERLVREWTRSGLLDKEMEERMLPELTVNLRRTNLFLRLILFGFGVLIIAAAVLLVGVTSGMRDEVAIAGLCIVAAACSVGIAEFLIESFRLYRFGIEEASAVSFISLLAIAVLALLSKESHPWRNSPEFAALIAAAIAALVVYARFGYIYAVLLSMFFAGIAPFATELSEMEQRIVCAGILAIVFVVARMRSLENRNEFPGNDYRIIQAAAWLGIYAALNLHLTSFWSIVVVQGITTPFYFFTYAAIWLLPSIGIFLGVRDRDRVLLDVSLVLSLVTLATNKPYLYLPRQTWDPILLGLLLIGTAIALRRWLSKGDRNGFTSARILLSDKRGIAAIATASAALHTAAPQSPAQPDRSFHGEGGRSGGAGASGSF